MSSASALAFASIVSASLFESARSFSASVLVASDSAFALTSNSAAFALMPSASVSASRRALVVISSAVSRARSSRPLTCCSVCSSACLTAARGEAPALISAIRRLTRLMCASTARRS